MGTRSEHPPRVSITVPNFNKRAYISQAIKSVLRQTIEDLELAIVDDASTDGSAEIADQYARNDPRLTMIRQVANTGFRQRETRESVALRAMSSVSLIRTTFTLRQMSKNNS